MAEQMISLVSSDGDKVQYAKSVCEKSVLLKGMIEDLGEEEEDIPVQIVTKELKTVMTFCEYIVNNAFPAITKPLTTNDFSECLQGHEWFSDFVQKLDNDEMFAVGLAANALDCPELLDLISCKVATLTMGKTVAE